MKKLNGFSLIEVMIMFLTLSVILAGSMTMISKKTTPPMQKVSHGVYRCIMTPDGNLWEEQYSGTQRIKNGSPVGGKCSFKVPEAAMYKIDMYTAGSGGTKAAQIKAEKPEKEVDANIHVTLHVANPPISKLDTVFKNQLYTPTDKEMYEILNGKYIVDSIYTADGGFGGGVHFTYPSVIDSSCITEEGKKAIEDKMKEYEEKLERIEKHRYVVDNVSGWGKKISYRGSAYDKYFWGGSDHEPDCNDGAEDDVYCDLLHAIISPLKEDTITRISSSGTYTSYLLLYNIKNDKLKQGAMAVLEANPHIYQDLGYLSPYDYIFDHVGFYDGGFASLYYTTINGDRYIISDNDVPCYYDPRGSITDMSFQDAYNLDAHVRLRSVMDNEEGWDDKYGTHCIKEVKKNLDLLTDIIYETLKNQDSLEMVKDYLYKAKINVGNRYKNGDWVMHGDSDGDYLWLSTQKALLQVYARSIRHTIVGTFDDGSNDSYTWIVSFRDLVNDILDEAVKLYKEDHINRFKNLVDLPQNQRFNKTYSERSVMNERTYKQILDYCKLEFKPYYQEIKGWKYNSDDDKIKEEITFGDTRLVRKFGGDEGYGRMARFIYKINYNPNNGGSFANYIKNLYNNYYPIVCTENNPATCTRTSDPGWTYQQFVRWTKIHGDAILKGEDANLTGKINYDENLGGITEKDVVSREYDYEKAAKNQLEGFTYNNNLKRRYADLSNGGEPSKYLYWNVQNQQVQVLNKRATGGIRPIIYVDESNVAPYSRPSLTKNGCNVYDWSCHDANGKEAKASDVFSFQKVAYTADAETNPGNGLNVKFNTNLTDNSTYSIAPVLAESATYDIDSIVKSFNPTKYPLTQNPGIFAKSWIWTKTYSLGADGKQGKLWSATESDLGTNCTFTVPKPGAVYSPNVDDYDALNKALGTSMKCVNKDGKVVFEHTLTGPGYQNGFVSGAEKVNNNVFKWNQDVNEDGDVHIVSLKDSTEKQPVWRPTSFWSKLFNKYMIPQNGEYDLQSVYNTGKAGKGTELKDYCLARRGKFSAFPYYRLVSPHYYSKYGRGKGKTGCSYKLLSDGDKDECKLYSNFTGEIHAWPAQYEDHEKDIVKYAIGNYKGYNCYGYDTGSANNESSGHTYELYENSPIVQSGIVEMTATKGGGGAVVITW